MAEPGIQQLKLDTNLAVDSSIHIYLDYSWLVAKLLAVDLFELWECWDSRPNLGGRVQSTTPSYKKVCGESHMGEFFFFLFLFLSLTCFLLDIRIILKNRELNMQNFL